MKLLEGIQASDGIVIGKCYILDRQKVNVKRYSITEKNVDSEIDRLNRAVKASSDYIESVKSLGQDELSESHQFIFDVYLMILKDDMLVGEAKRTISSKFINAEFALSSACNNLITMFKKSDNEYLRERSADVEHVVQKVLRHMSEIEQDTLEDIDNSTVVVAHDLSPSDAALVHRRGLKGFVTDLGSKVSHTSILARALGMTAVVGLENVSLKAGSGDIIIIDGFEGHVIISPDENLLEEYKEKQKRYELYIHELEKLKTNEAVTQDGYKIGVFSNVEINDEIPLSNENNAEGIGLYRTEYIYLENGNVSEEKQFQILREAAVLNGDKPLTVRTFDLGNEKISKEMPHVAEQNPVMGLRAIRYSLKYQDFFKKQLRAILRASSFGKFKIMFPMISGMEEFFKCKQILWQVMEELKNENIEFDDKILIGVMMELPSLALIAGIIAKEVDFMSVGTNDLIQYTLGIDRNNEYVAYLYRPAHPAVITTLENIITACAENNVECSVCGELAGDPKYIPMLLGLGYRHLSMSPPQLLKVKMVLSRLSIKECVELVKNLKNCVIAREAEELLKEFVESHVGEVYFH